MKRKKRYISDIPAFLAEWDYENNDGLSPETVSIGSRTMVNWICSVCHGSYPAYAYNRNAGKGCPYCAGKKVLVGFNDLKTKHPEIAAEWDYEANGDETPEDVTIGMSGDRHWICRIGHKYTARIPDRIKGNGCPYCSGRKLLTGFNDLQTTNPDIAAEWHPTLNGSLKPSDVQRGMTDKVFWLCSECGKEWPASPNSRTHPNGSGCPICGKKKQKQSRIQKMLRNGQNSLETCNPFLAKEWHPTMNKPKLPSQFTRSSNETIWWLCSKCGNSWPDSINHRSNGRGCPECSERSTSFSEQIVFYFVKQYYPDAVSRDKSNGFELDIFIPSLSIGIEYDGAYFHGKNKHGMSDKKKDEECINHNILLYRIREKGLPNTKGAVNIHRKDEYNSALEECISLLLKQIGVLEIGKISISDNLAAINDLYTETFKKNSLAALRPDIAAEWHPTLNGKLTPEQVTVSSGRDCYWICKKCGEPFHSSVASRTAGHGCNRCARKLVGEKLKTKNLIKGQNDLASLYPKIAAEWDYGKNGDSPSDYLPGSNDKKHWICSKCGKSYRAAICNRVRGSACRTCGIESSRKKRSKSVICVETGQVFDTLQDAAAWAGCSRSSISYAASKKTKKARGYTWEYVSETSTD